MNQTVPPQRLLIIVLTFACAVASVTADENTAPLHISFDQRLRLATWDNAISLDESAAASVAYTRTRTRLGAVWSPSSIVSFDLRLTNEFRYYLAPTSVDFDLNEIFIDHLNARLRLPSTLPLTVTIGRQDIMLGEGFVVFDSSPLDGSRSAYFNALRFDWDIRSNHQLTAFACHQQETDSRLPVIHEFDQRLVEQPETGLGLYYRSKWSHRDLQVYLVRLKRDDNMDYPIGSAITTIGGRLEQPVLRAIDLTAVIEAGFQFGTRADADRKAWGGHGHLAYRPGFQSKRFYLPTTLTAGLIYLSGDDPNTRTFEGWDPMFARWPKWSDSYIYTQIREHAVAWWTNLVSLNMATQFRLTPSTDLKFTWHHLVAPQEPDSAAGFPGGTGRIRGELYIGKVSLAIDRHWSGHVLGEYFDPGSYYFDGADSYLWFRTEISYRY